MKSIVVSLHIPPEEFQRLYEGSARDVNALSVDGRRVRFPANVLRPFVTHAGVVGRFTIYFSAENRFQCIEKID